MTVRLHRFLIGTFPTTRKGTVLIEGNLEANILAIMQAKLLNTVYYNFTFRRIKEC